MTKVTLSKGAPLSGILYRMQPELERKLRGIDRFSMISPGLLEDVAARGRFQKFAKGETVFFEGDDCETLYIVAAGAIKIAKTLESGKELILDILGQGETVGEVALLDELPYPATATAHLDSELFVLPASDYFVLIDTHPELARASIRDLAARLRNMSRRIKDVSGGNVEYRIAHLLLTLAARIGRTEGNAIHVDMLLSRQEIADMVGTAIETAIRVMSRWQKEGIVTTSKTGFVVHDKARLQEISEASL